MNTVAQPRLETAIREGLAPSLRQDAFQGSGRKFHRLVGSWIELITVQGSRWGGSFAVNLGIHFAAAPDVAGVVPNLKTMTEANCEFRRRLSEDRADHWWKHDGSASSMLGAIQSASDIYARVGSGYFSQAIRALEALEPPAVASGCFNLEGFGTTRSRFGLAMARIRKLEGKLDQCKGFAAYGLQHLGSAGFLRVELEALADA